MLVALFRRVYKERLVPDVPAPQFGIERALVKVQVLRVHLVQNPAWLRALHVLLYEAVTQLPAIAGWSSAWLDWQQEMLAALLAGRHDGSVRADLDPELEARRFMDHGLGIGYRWTIERDDRAYDADLRDWGEMFRRRWQPVR